MSKYDPLAHFLKTQKSAETPMSFLEIEKVLGFELPPSARQHPAWWSNNVGTHVNARAWREAGWRTSRVDLGSERVTFVRDPDFGRDAMGVSEGESPFIHRPAGPSAKAVVIPLDGLSLSALRMIDDWAEEAGVDRSTATAAILEASAAGRRRRLLESLSVAVMPPGHDSTALIRQDRDEH
ncbi:DUF7662 domain-containing protein [Phenylobacterium sp.]|uniref:DUF7662 domain-containing protein n=1 Tax=Phenylobacterium sp. TaxID=1871053 RepID=UPI002CC87164|nr:hypothetical protein [Phenylobacterium sp.]HLZ75353.1 hypothetical protein [Phenylobacterium sp.]